MPRHAYGNLPPNAFQTLGQGFRNIGAILSRDRREQEGLDRETAERDQRTKLIGNLPHISDAAAAALGAGVDPRIALVPEATPRNIDPLSDEGITARAKVREHESQFPLSRESTGPRQATTLEAGNAVLKRFGTWNDENYRYVLPEEATEEWFVEATGAQQRGEPIPPIPRPIPVAEPLVVGAPETQGSPSGGIGRFLSRFIPGRTEIGGRLLSEIEQPATDSLPLEPEFRPPAPVTVAPPITRELQSQPDTTGMGAARARARELQAQGKSREEIVSILNAEGFNVEL